MCFFPYFLFFFFEFRVTCSIQFRFESVLPIRLAIHLKQQMAFTITKIKLEQFIEIITAVSVAAQSDADRQIYPSLCCLFFSSNFSTAADQHRKEKIITHQLSILEQNTKGQCTHTHTIDCINNHFSNGVKNDSILSFKREQVNVPQN